jgi:hypothetical protein
MNGYKISLNHEGSLRLQRAKPTKNEPEIFFVSFVTAAQRPSWFRASNYERPTTNYKPASIRRRAFRNTLSIIGAVSLPVLVFCRLG